jgi:hypothetical protein
MESPPWEPTWREKGSTLTDRPLFCGVMSGDHYTTAAVCLNGHVASRDAETNRGRLSKFCSTCGAETITACSNCGATIRGHYVSPGASAVGGFFRLASYCYECGKPYPWTAEKRKAAKGLADELEGATAEDREKLKTAIDDLAAAGPRAQAGAALIKRMLGKASTAVGQALYKMTVDIASESAKEILTSNEVPRALLSFRKKKPE